MSRLRRWLILLLAGKTPVGVNLTIINCVVDLQRGVIKGRG